MDCILMGLQFNEYVSANWHPFDLPPDDYLDVKVVYLVKKYAYVVLVAPVVQQEEFDVSGCQEGGDVFFLEFVDTSKCRRA